MKVFGLGFPKTGTTSLEGMLHLLGVRHCVSHWNQANTNFLVHAWKSKDYAEIKRVINYYDGFADLPWGGTDLYLFLLENYPKEKFILTERDPENWFNSLKNMVSKFMLPENEVLNFHYFSGWYGFVNWIETFFDVPAISDLYKDKIISKYLLTNQQIKDECKRKNIELLIVNTTQLNEWGPVCSHLGLPIPKIDVPRFNPAAQKGQIDQEEAFVLIKFYLKINKLDAASHLLNQLINSGIQASEVDILSAKLKSAIAVNEALQVKSS